MKCRVCDTSLADDPSVRFCSYCGAPVDPKLPVAMEGDGGKSKPGLIPGIKLTKEHVILHRGDETLMQIPREQVENALKVGATAIAGILMKRFQERGSGGSPSADSNGAKRRRFGKPKGDL